MFTHWAVHIKRPVTGSKSGIPEQSRLALSSDGDDVAIGAFVTLNVEVTSIGVTKMTHSR